METVSYLYRFEFPNGREELFEIHLDGATMRPREGLPPVLPDWTRLEFKQCDGCRLPYGSYTHCPLAAHISPIVERMSVCEVAAAGLRWRDRQSHRHSSLPGSR